MMTEALDRAARTIRDEGENEYWSIDPSQFVADDERSKMASRDPEVDTRIETEQEAREIAERLANFLEYRVEVQKFVKSGALRDNFEEDGKFTIYPWSN